MDPKEIIGTLRRLLKHVIAVIAYEPNRVKEGMELSSHGKGYQISISIKPNGPSDSTGV